MPKYKLFWAPEGRAFQEVEAPTPREAIRKADQPYRKYLGEIYAEEITNGNRLDSARTATTEGASANADESLS